MLDEMKVKEFIKELASNSPAPGGGSVACVNGAMAAGLGAMVCRLTIGKEIYKDVEDLFKEKLPKLDKLHAELTELIDKDANAFNGVMASFKMPKDTDEQIIARSKKIQEEYKKAALVPMSTARACKKVLDIILELGTQGNKNAVSDIAVGALNALTGLKSAILNVQINLPSIKDETFKSETRIEIEEMLKGADEKVQNLIDAAKSQF